MNDLQLFIENFSIPTSKIVYAFSPSHTLFLFSFSTVKMANLSYLFRRRERETFSNSKKRARVNERFPQMDGECANKYHQSVNNRHTRNWWFLMKFVDTIRN